MVARNKKKPSIKDVAEKSGVSTATVSHVINGTRYVSEEVSNKVKNAMKELQYVPNPIARSLRSQHSHIIGLIIPVKRASDTANLFFMTIAQGIEATLTKNGYKLILCNSYEDVELEQEHIDMFNAQQVDGLIIAPVTEDYTHIQEQYPIVFIDRKPAAYKGDCVFSNNYQGAYEATDHLIKKGHTKIGFMTGDMNISTGKDRFDGYKQALLDSGIEIQDSYIKFGDVNLETGYQLAKELMEKKEVSALFVANNILTMGAIRYFQDYHVKIPDEMAIIGFDDYEWSMILNPPLTSVKQPAFEMGQKAAEVMLERIHNPSIEPKCYIMDTNLIIRKTT
ncbi:MULTISPECIES: LacI family DNA-binding transcriptional regulator [Bacillus]|uniref:LacI family DNA-binding transcriptional regulator n=1 Tax=Bacillus TaxID=1386 RepID=UPI0002EF74C2|nr:MULTISPECIES: LacI family DNA-binding transcriptional regulator [Bacillus]